MIVAWLFIYFCTFIISADSNISVHKPSHVANPTQNSTAAKEREGKSEKFHLQFPKYAIWSKKKGQNCKS